jgi:hypothetical protein
LSLFVGVFEKKLCQGTWASRKTSQCLLLQKHPQTVTVYAFALATLGDVMQIGLILLVSSIPKQETLTEGEGLSS